MARRQRKHQKEELLRSLSYHEKDLKLNEQHLKYIWTFFRRYKIVELFIWAYPLHNIFNMPCLACWYSVLEQALLGCSIDSSDTGILLIFKKGRLRSWSKEAYISQKFLSDFCLYLTAQCDGEWALLVAKFVENVGI